jgi:hypothetical protein
MSQSNRGGQRHHGLLLEQQLEELHVRREAREAREVDADLRGGMMLCDVMHMCDSP